LIADWAGKYIGLPYKDACWGPDYYDCWGLITLIYEKEFDIRVHENMTMYSDKVGKVERMLKYISSWIPIDEPIIGDGMLFLVANRLPHCGIYVGDNRMIHTISGVSSCIQRVDNPRWKSRFEGYYRYRQSNS